MKQEFNMGGFVEYIESLRKSLSQIEQYLDTIPAYIKELDEKIDASLDKEILAKYKTDLGTIKRQSSVITKSLREEKDLIRKFLAVKDAWHEDRVKVEAVNADIKELLQQTKLYQEHVERMNEALAGLKNQSDSIETVQEESNAVLEEMQTWQTALEGQESALSDVKQVLSDHIDQVQKQKESVTKLNKALQNQHGAVIDSLQEAIDTQQSTVQEVSSSVQTIQQDLQNNIKHILSGLRRVTDEQQISLRDLSAMMRRLEKFSSSISQATAANLSSVQEMKKWKDSLQEKQTSLEDTSDSFQEYLQSIQKQETALQQTQNNLQDEIAKFEEIHNQDNAHAAAVREIILSERLEKPFAELGDTTSVQILWRKYRELDTILTRCAGVYDVKRPDMYLWDEEPEMKFTLKSHYLRFAVLGATCALILGFLIGYFINH